MIRVLGVSLLTLALVCCPSLNVEVAILEREIVDKLIADDRLKNALPKIRVELKADVQRQANEIEATHYAVYSKSAAAIETEIKKLCEAETTCDKKLQAIAKISIRAAMTLLKTGTQTLRLTVKNGTAIGTS